MDYDVIGDVHGQDGKLTALLAKLGYRVKDGAYRHPEGRMALFLGDLVDRGPGQVEVLDIVRDMIEAGSGRSIMGNHEWNAIGFATRDPEGRLPASSYREQTQGTQGISEAGRPRFAPAQGARGLVQDPAARP